MFLSNELQAFLDPVHAFTVELLAFLCSFFVDLDFTCWFKFLKFLDWNFMSLVDELLSLLGVLFCLIMDFNFIMLVL